MNEVLKNQISDSAYLVNVSRARSLHISKDNFAYLWIPIDKKAEIQDLWNKYALNVYRFDDIELAVRTNYFITSLRKHLERFPNTVFINLGSGFTSYQYLINQEILTIEVDFPSILLEKRNRADKLIKEKILPNRSTLYLPCDFNNAEQRVKLYKKIYNEIGRSRHTYILMEGLLYYLPKLTAKKILHNNQVLQRQDSIIAFDYWKPTIKKREYYKGMLDFYCKEMKMENVDLNLFYAKKFVDLSCYSILDDTDVFKQERLMLDSFILNKNKGQCLEECYFKIQRKACTQPQDIENTYY